ncbi:CDP-glycerol glycerophosphotransferase family protein [Streptomyces sp. N1]|uniref:bifunctional glycosyltransferase/CDP-glycerol:glycerophosphate glycerophosphotransferase n=1 Tax=Streptomyces sp. N1 TaxID=576456 RepID=UPI0010113F3A|nr:CDP-glycerol glycerophosphotransferase family protein [Streptomyces sp. N1]
MTTEPHPADAPDLSVVVPADAGPEALRACAASVLEQTLRHSEAVLVDPGRDSATTRACADLAARHPGRVRHVTAARGADLRDTGADHARGTWVTFLGPGERLQKDAGRNLLAAALDTGADLVAGTWTRLPAPGEKLPRGAEQAEPAWQRPLHTRTRTVGSLTDAPGLVVHDSLVTGFCVRRSLLDPEARPAVRHEEAPPVGDLLFGVRAALAARTVTLIPNTITTHRAAPDPAADAPARITAAARAARLLARHGHPGLAAARERALLTDHVLPCAAALLSMDREERARTAAQVAPLLAGHLGADALAPLDPVARACLRLLADGDADGARDAAYALANPGTVVSPVVAHAGRVHWRPGTEAAPSTEAAPGADPLDVTELGLQYRPFARLDLLNTVTRATRSQGRLLLVGRIVLPAHALPGRPEVTATLVLTCRDQPARTLTLPVDDIRYAKDALVWRACADLTRLLGARGVGDRVWDPALRVTAGGETLTTPLFAEPETVKPAGALRARPRLGRLTGDTWQPYVTAHHRLAVCLLARRRPARLAEKLLHYATHFRPARALRRRLAAVAARRKRLAGQAVKARVYRTLLLRLPVRKGQVVYEAHMGKQYGDSPRAIHEEAMARGLPLRPVWSYAERPDGFPADARLVRRWSWPYLVALARAQYWVDNQGFPHALDKPRHTTYLQTWHGSAYKRMGFDEARVKTQNDPQRRRLQRAVDRFDHFLIRAPHDADTLGRAYRLDPDKLLPTGYPRNDRLVAAREQHAPRPPLAEALGIPDDRTVVLYAPTFRGGPGHKDAELPLDVRRFAEQFGSTHVLLVRSHYMERAALPATAPGTVHDVSGHHDVSELLALADVLVTDYSSIMFDYALLDRPLIHFAPDLDAYTADRGSYFDLRERAGGPVVDTQDALHEVLAHLDEADPHWKAARARFAEEFGAYDTGGAAAAVVDTLFAAHTPRRRPKPCPASRRRPAERSGT